MSLALLDGIDENQDAVTLARGLSLLIRPAGKVLVTFRPSAKTPSMTCGPSDPLETSGRFACGDPALNFVRAAVEAVPGDAAVAP